MKNFGTMQAAIGESQKSGKSDPNHHSPHLNIYPFFPLFRKKRLASVANFGDFVSNLLLAQFVQEILRKIFISHFVIVKKQVLNY